MTWYVCQHGARFNVVCTGIRPTTAVSEHDDFGEALREKARLETERAVAQQKEEKP